MSAFHKSVYVTKCVCTDFASARKLCTQDMANEYHGTVAPRMDRQDSAIRYSPFGEFVIVCGGGFW